MNIVQLNNFIEKIVSCTEIVKSFYTNSVYECWNAEEVKYGSISFCITKTQMRERTMTYDAIIYYGDRLLEDKSNRNAIWSDATQVIQSIIGTVNSVDGEITISYPYNLTLFEQKFADELAGAYAEISIEVEGVGECGDLLYGYEDEEGVKLESVVKTFTINGEYDIIPSDGFDAISDVKVIVNVPIQSKSVEFNSNGSYNVTPDSEYAAMDNVAVNVNIPMQSKSVTYSEVGDYQVIPDPGYGALSKVDVKVSLEGKTQIPNGFVFTGGDMSLVEWDKYDWSMVYDTTGFFKGCSSSDPNWFDRFKNGFNGKLLSGSSMFYNFNSNQSIDFTGIDTSQMVSGTNMFQGCKFTNIRGLDSSNMITIGAMFRDCKVLEYVDIINTNNVTDMSYMFYGCNKITTAPQMNTLNVTDMRNMFYECRNLTSIPQLDTSNVKNMYQMFYYCSSLNNIPPLNTSNVVSMSYMFQGCSSLTNILQLDTSNVTSMGYMFCYCHKLASIPQLDISKVTDMSYMFRECYKLLEIKFKGKPTSNLKVTAMFDDIAENGILYYDSRYDYSKIIEVLPPTWTAVTYTVID